MTMQCPTCRTETQWVGNPFRPFCSERCKLLDLGKWAAGAYRLPSEEKPSQEFQSSSGNRDEE